MQSIVNREARSRYEFLEHYEGGLVLSGAEVKSVKRGHMHLKGAYISYEKGELWLKNAHISAYQEPNQSEQNPERPRKVLMRRKEIDSLMGKTQREGLTLIPEKVYSKHGLIKVSIALARGLKKHDRREKLKKREIDRKITRALRKKI